MISLRYVREIWWYKITVCFIPFCQVLIPLKCTPSSKIQEFCIWAEGLGIKTAIDWLLEHFFFTFQNLEFCQSHINV